MSVGAKLRELRGSRSQLEVANVVGISKSALAMYERDERVPRDEIKIRLADYYGQSVQFIFYST